MCCNWSVLAHRVCVSVIQCFTYWTVWCVVIGLCWHRECVCLLYSAALIEWYDVLLLVCVGTTSVFVCYTWLQSLDGVMCFNLFLLVQRVYVCVCVCVCVCVILCSNDWMMCCFVIGLCWYSECACVWYTVLHWVNIVMCFNWLVLAQRVCVWIIQCFTERTVWCVLIGLCWYSEFVCVCVCLLYSAALKFWCDILYLVYVRTAGVCVCVCGCVCVIQCCFEWIMWCILLVFCWHSEYMCVCMLHSAALIGRCDVLYLFCFSTASVCVCVCVLYSVAPSGWCDVLYLVCVGIACVSVSVVQCCTDWKVWCALFVLCWYCECVCVCVYVLYVAAQCGRCDVF